MSGQGTNFTSPDEGYAGKLAVNGSFASVKHTFSSGSTQDNTLNSLWFGDSAKLNKKDLQIAYKMAA